MVGYSYQSKEDGHLNHSIKLSDIDKSLVRLYPRNLAEKNMILPIYRSDGILFILTVSDDCNVKVAEIEAFLDHQGSVSVHQIDKSLFWKVLSTSYIFQECVQNIITQIKTPIEQGVSNVLQPVKECINFIINEAIIENASAIHIEPEKKIIRVRYRKNGVMQDKCRLPSSFNKLIISYLKKTLTNLNGKLHYIFDDTPVDLTFSFAPTINGENTVIKLTTKKENFISFNNLGISNDIKEKFFKSNSNGIYIVSGPKKSGKTTTLYSMISDQTSVENKIASIEENIEYNLPFVRQTKINDIDCLKNIKNIINDQDIDILMLSEIKNNISANISIDNALKGKKVYTSIESNSCVSTINRLIDFGISLRQIATNVKLIINQRLLRKLCNLCKRKAANNNNDNIIFEKYNIKNTDNINMPVGCTHCFNTGYNSQQIITECLFIDDNIKTKILNDDFFKIDNLENNFVSMHTQAFNLIKNGTTTLDEVMRVINL